jgi:O-methyltransferase involved in polyketide biosynthesis
MTSPTTRPGQPPTGIDATVATAARMYDYWLGGHDNFAADRVAALKLTERVPQVPEMARANRAFLGRAVRFLAGEAGIRQFLDLGTGLPTRGNVHEVAQAVAPDARVVYVDNDPMVLAHARALKTGAGTAVIHADLRDADAILGHPETQRLIDFSQPVAILLVAVLHFVGDPDAHQAVARYVSAAGPGSYLVLGHGSTDTDPAISAASTSVYAGTANPGTPRSRRDILAFFDGLDLLEPGLVPVRLWRPDEPDPEDDSSKSWYLGGVARFRDDHVAVPVPAATRQQARPAAHVPAPRAAAPAPFVAGEERPPPGIDASVATAARMYDYWLGGHDNFAADRVAGLKLLELFPDGAEVARGNRAFLGRAVRFLAGEAGISQFLDLGTGLPTQGNVHQVAQAINPDAHVVYVDNDPMVLAHSRALKTGEGTAVLNADLRDTDTVLSHPDTQRLIDFSQPVAVLFAAVLHFLPGTEPYEAVARYAAMMVPGSYLVVTHVIMNTEDPEASAAGIAVYARTANPISGRTRQEILDLFDGFDLLEPGLVAVQRWRPDEPGAESQSVFGGVARKPVP